MDEGTIKNLDFQILVCFFCDTPIRRAYLAKFIESLERALGDGPRVEVIFIDGSSEEGVKLNRRVIERLRHPLIYLADAEVNPLIRIRKNLEYLTKKNILWLLEDQVLHAEGADLISEISLDCGALGKLPNNSVIQYPVVNSDFLDIREGQICEFTPNKFKTAKAQKIKDRYLYPRSEDRKHLNFLCHNVLYKVSFFRKHITYYSARCSGHSAAEGDIPDLSILQIFFKRRWTRFLAKLISNLMHSRNKIRKIYVSQSTQAIDFIHIGYESNEDSAASNIDRRKLENGSVVNSNLRLFSDIGFVDQMQTRKLPI